MFILSFESIYMQIWLERLLQMLDVLLLKLFCFNWFMLQHTTTSIFFYKYCLGQWIFSLLRLSASEWNQTRFHSAFLKVWKVSVQMRLNQPIVEIDIPHFKHSKSNFISSKRWQPSYLPLYMTYWVSPTEKAYCSIRSSFLLYGLLSPFLK